MNKNSGFKKKGAGGGGGRKTKSDVEIGDDPVLKMFSEISVYLDNRHDKKERIVKLSRDITIESKRIIFCLHRIKHDDYSNKDDVMMEASKRLEDLKRNEWSKVAVELKNEDPYQFMRAYSGGLQEWVEAISFYHFLKHYQIISFTNVCNELTFEDQGIEEVDKDELKTSHIHVTVPHSEYILGIADLTGELMRNAINAIGAGNMDACFQLLEILQCMSEGFGKMSKQDTPKDFGQKLWTLKQSCRKVEAACYAISVRGSEIPKNHWADIFSKKDDEKRDDVFTHIDDIL